MALKNLSTSDLRRELERRSRSSGKLQKRRQKLMEEIGAIDAELAALGEAVGSAASNSGTGPRRRARNKVSLPDAIAQSMEVGAVVSPKEASELVQANGYKTNSASFNMMVSNALSKDKRFKRLGRGQYERIK